MDDKLILNLENSDKNIPENSMVGFYRLKDNDIELINGQNIWRLFSDYYDQTVDEDKILHSWYHKPLVSGSIKYPGSYFKHEARIYYIDLETKILGIYL